MRVPMLVAILTVSMICSWAGAGERHVKLTAAGDSAGLKDIIEKWKSDELVRQGGKFLDHGWWLWGLVGFDYDNDGDIDFVAQHHGHPRSIVIRNQLKETGRLTFVNANPELGLPVNGLAGTFKPLAWDFDGDGFIDIAYYDNVDPRTFFFNKAGKKFEPMKFALAQVDQIKSVRDLNGDGFLDVYHDQAEFFYNPRTRVFVRHEVKGKDVAQPLHANPPEAIRPFIEKEKADFVPRCLNYYEGVDLNGDGNPDLACGYFGIYGGTRWGRYLLADGQGRFTDATEQLGLPHDGAPILFCDLTGDGIDDVLIAGTGLYVSARGGRYSLKPGPVSEFLSHRYLYSPAAVRVDLANAGHSDLAIHNGRNETAKIFENRGGGEFRELASQRTWTDGVVVCDINNDSLMDVVIAGPEDAITIYLNETANPGTGCLINPRMDKPNPYAVGSTIEVFKAGDLNKAGARPILSQQAHPDGTPIHFGLGDDTTFDLRVTFPGKKPKLVQFENVQANRRLKVTVDGPLEELN